MKKEVKIEDFIDSRELDSMSDKEREIYEKCFLLNKQNLQGLTDAANFINELNNKLDSIKIRIIKNITCGKSPYSITLKKGQIVESNKPDQGLNDDGTFTICQGMGIYHTIEKSDFEIILSE